MSRDGLNTSSTQTGPLIEERKSHQNEVCAAQMPSHTNAHKHDNSQTSIGSQISVRFVKAQDGGLDSNPSE